MVDTISLRLHNCQEYPTLIHYLFNNCKMKIRESDEDISGDENRVMMRVKFFDFIETGGKCIFANGEVMTSGHYHIAFSLPLGELSPYVDFNFSIPKYLYGTNIFQFVQHHTEFESVFDRTFCSSFYYNIRQTYDRLMRFVILFFKKSFGAFTTGVSLRDIEVRRIDLCWEQVFNNREDALLYCEYQNRIRKKWQRDTSDMRHTRFGSVFYSTKDYGAKIYHKGTEFKKKDALELKRVNTERGRKIYDVEELQRFADRVLRYEITFRSSYLSKIYRTKVFRRKSDDWQERLKYWRKLRRIHDYAFGKTLKDEVKREENFKKWNLLSSADRDFYEWWRKQKDKRVKFFFGIDRYTKNLNLGRTEAFLKSGEEEVPDKALFSRYLLKCCFSVLKSFIKEFEVREHCFLSDAGKKIKNFNETVKLLNEKDRGFLDMHKMNEERMRQIVGMLEYYSLSELLQKRMLSRATYYRYKKRFHDLQINPRGGTDVQIPNCSGFEWYHEAMFRPAFEIHLKNNIFL